MLMMTKANNLFFNDDEGGDINGKWKFKVSSVNTALLTVGQVNMCTMKAVVGGDAVQQAASV